MTPLSLAIIRQRYTQDGGAERFVARALRALQAEGVSVSLVTRTWNAGKEMRLLHCDPFYLGSLWRDWGFARRACRLLAAQRFDLIQSHERVACCDIFRAGDGLHREWLRQRSRGLGWWGQLRIALNPYHHYVKAAERAVLTHPRLKAVICISQMVRDEIKRNFDLPDDKLVVIYNGLDVTKYHPDLRAYRDEVRRRHGIPPEALLFLFVGSGFERKGIKTLLDAAARLPANAHLMVVGRDKKRSRFEMQAKRLGIAERVHFLGTIPEVAPYYGAADTFVLPTIYEPFGNVVLEAMACGLPVVTSFSCGAGELIKEGENGYVCDARDDSALAERMMRMMDRQECERMGLSARRTVEGMTLDRMGQELARLYSDLTQRYVPR